MSRSGGWCPLLWPSFDKVVRWSRLGGADSIEWDPGAYRTHGAVSFIRRFLECRFDCFADLSRDFRESLIHRVVYVLGRTFCEPLDCFIVRCFVVRLNIAVCWLPTTHTHIPKWNPWSLKADDQKTGIATPFNISQQWRPRLEHLNFIPYYLG
jgi:hypothetical protein